MIVGIFELHHSRSSEDTAERVRGAQEGRVRDGNGSAGDFPYGYASVFSDPVAAAAYRGRGPKPKRDVIVEACAARVVNEVFFRFAVAGESISAIVRWWQQHKHRFPTLAKTRMHHEHVRRILTNEKYIGTWRFGVTSTVYDGNNRKKQSAARSDQTITVVRRPTLRIVDQELWDQAQARLAKLKVIYGMKPQGKKRGPAEHYRLFYEKTLLGRLVHCRACGARMIVGRGGMKRLICPNHRVGTCRMSAGVPCAKAEEAILDLLSQLFQAYPDWLKAVAAATRQKLEQLARAMPQELTAAQKQLDEIHQQAGNLTDAIASGVSSPTVRTRLAALEAQKPVLEQRILHLQQVRQSQTDLPADEWIGEELRSLTGLLTRIFHTPSFIPLIFAPGGLTSLSAQHRTAPVCIVVFNFSSLRSSQSSRAKGVRFIPLVAGTEVSRQSA